LTELGARLLQEMAHYEKTFMTATKCMQSNARLCNGLNQDYKAFGPVSVGEDSISARSAQCSRIFIRRKQVICKTASLPLCVQLYDLRTISLLIDPQARGNFWQQRNFWGVDLRALQPLALDSIHEKVCAINPFPEA
jgi:hypothetical protein